MIIDFHTHAFPEKIANRAIEKLTLGLDGIVPQFDGTIDSLKKEMKKDGVSISVVLGIATSPKQQFNVNNFAAEISKEDSLFGFGSVHPDAPDALDELERIKGLGLKGVKLHPEYQSFYPDDEKMKPIYRRISELGLVVLFHAGYGYGFADSIHGRPENFLNALKWIDTEVVAAHWGGTRCWEDVFKLLCGEDIWFDLAFSYGNIPEPLAQKILDKHTPDRLLFGSDMPWHRPSWEVKLVESLDVSDKDKEKIYYKNAAKLLGLNY